MKYTCPISFNTVDHNVIRLVGLFTLILIITSFFNLFGEYSKYIMLFLTFDFLMRIFNDKLSLLKIISVNILHGILKIKPQEVGAAPKRFAAGIGALFSILIFGLLFISDYFISKPHILNMDNIFFTIKHSLHILTIMLVVAISLETFFGFCLGCKIYSYIQFFKSKWKKTT